jgi:hypothetical protein
VARRTTGPSTPGDDATNAPRTLFRAPLARENTELRERVAELTGKLEATRRAQLSADPGTMFVHLSGLVGRLLLAARQGHGALFHEAARVVEGVRDALMKGDATRDREARATIERALAAALVSAAAVVNLAVRGKERTRLGKWREDGPIAAELRDLFAPWFTRDTTAIGTTLGAALDVCARCVGADRILPPEGSPEEREALYDAAIREVLATNPGRSPETLAEKAIVACAAACGIRRPSRLFDAEAKADKRRAARSDVKGRGHPPGGVRTAAQRNEVPPSSQHERDAPHAAAPDVSPRTPSRRDPLRRGDNRSMVGGPRKRSSVD